MISIIENTCVEHKKWITHDEMMNVTVVAESTPGPISINCATYIGYQQGKLLGSIAATAGVVLPSFLIIYVISMFLDRFLEFTLVANAFRGIQCAVGILIFNAAVNMIRKMEKNRLSWGILTVSFGVMLAVDLFSWNFSSISLILIAATFSLVFYMIRTLGKGGDQQ